MVEAELDRLNLVLAASVEAEAALGVAASQETVLRLVSLVDAWRGVGDEAPQVLGSVIRESADPDERALAALLLIIEECDRPAAEVISETEVMIPSLAGGRIVHLIWLSPINIAFWILALDLSATSSASSEVTLLEHATSDPSGLVQKMSAIAAAVIGRQDIVGPALSRQLRIAPTAAAAAGAAVGLGLVETADRWIPDLMTGAKADPDENVRAACYAGIALNGGDSSGGLFDVHRGVRSAVTFWLDSPLSVRQQSRLLQAVSDERLDFLERLAAAAKLLSEPDHDHFISQVARFLTTNADPRVPYISQLLLSDDLLPPETRARLAVAINGDGSGPS